MTLKLSNAEPHALISVFSVKKNVVCFLLFCFNFSSASIFRLSNRVIWVRMPAWCVGLCWLQASLMSRLRLRPRLPSLVQSSPFLLSPVLCLCLPCCLLCSSSCVFPFFCPCFLAFLFSFTSPGFRPSLSAGPGWCFSLSLCFVLLMSVSVSSGVRSVCCRVRVLHSSPAVCFASLPV